MNQVDFSYLLTPFLAWLFAGCMKFAINSLKAGKLAFGQIGYGGLPSNHSAIVASMVALVGIKVGIGHPAFGVALTLAFVVMLDANSLRRQVGLHAVHINRLDARTTDGPTHDAQQSVMKVQEPKLRERMGHTRLEIGAGVVVGAMVAWAVSKSLP